MAKDLNGVKQRQQVEQYIKSLDLHLCLTCWHFNPKGRTPLSSCSFAEGTKVQDFCQHFYGQHPIDTLAIGGEGCLGWQPRKK